MKHYVDMVTSVKVLEKGVLGELEAMRAIFYLISHSNETR